MKSYTTMRLTTHFSRLSAMTCWGSIITIIFLAASITRGEEIEPRFKEVTHRATMNGSLYEVSYAPLDQEGELKLGVTYRLWLPDGVKKVRGVIVHQHGCGRGACEGGQTAALDWHWQALATKWDCALLGPAYQQDDQQNCRWWCDPRNGSEKTFLRALDQFAVASSHAELATAPWCLWGHSGGAFWASLMQTRHPQRIVAVWLRSGSAFSAWEKGDIEKPTLSPDVYAVPTVCNPGAKENGDMRFRGAWDGALAMFHAYRAQGALISFTPDPRTSHECGDCRYLAIPFFDTCLGLRLPRDAASGAHLPSLMGQPAWLATLQSNTVQAESEFSGDKLSANWLPSESFATAWSEYVKVGAVSDTTQPPLPRNIKVSQTKEGTELTWEITADLESGVQMFVIERNGEQIGQVPQKPVGRFGRPLFQTMSYHDTPEKNWPELRFIDTQTTDATAEYRLYAVNSVGLRSEPSAPIKLEK